VGTGDAPLQQRRNNRGQAGQQQSGAERGEPGRTGQTDRRPRTRADQVDAHTLVGDELGQRRSRPAGRAQRGQLRSPVTDVEVEHVGDRRRSD
jgi:hypothetical protein